MAALITARTGSEEEEPLKASLCDRFKRAAYLRHVESIPDALAIASGVRQQVLKTVESEPPDPSPDQAARLDLAISASCASIRAARPEPPDRLLETR